MSSAEWHIELKAVVVAEGHFWAAAGLCLLFSCFKWYNPFFFFIWMSFINDLVKCMSHSVAHLAAVSCHRVNLWSVCCRDPLPCCIILPRNNFCLWLTHLQFSWWLSAPFFSEWCSMWPWSLSYVNPEHKTFSRHARKPDAQLNESLVVPLLLLITVQTSLKCLEHRTKHCIFLKCLKLKLKINHQRVQKTMFWRSWRCFYQSVVVEAIFCAVVCCGSITGARHAGLINSLKTLETSSDNT